MKILFVGDLSKYSRTYQRYLVFKKLYSSVDSLSTELNYTPGVSKKKNLIYRIFFKLGVNIDQYNINKKLLNLTFLKKYDLIWFEKTNQINRKTLKKIKKYSSSNLVYYTNDNINLFHNISINFIFARNYFDYFVIIKDYAKEYNKIINKKKIISIIRGYDENYIYPKIKQSNFKYKVVFIGSYEKIRHEYINCIALNDIKVDVFGNGWKKIKSTANLTIHNKPLYFDDYIEVLHNAYLVLNFFRKKNFDKTTGRTFEIPASGTLMLSERSDPSVNLFREDIEAVYFNNKKELLDKINYCFKNRSFRINLIKNAISKINKNNYSYLQIISKALKNIK
jgi:spore maturation protein CgeB